MGLLASAIALGLGALIFKNVNDKLKTADYVGIVLVITGIILGLKIIKFILI